MEYQFLDKHGKIHKKHFASVIEALAYANKNGYVFLGKGE